MKHILSFALFLSFGLFLVTTPACSPKIDPVGIQNASNISTKLSELMNKANTAFGPNATAVSTLLTEINTAYEHAKSVKRNKEIAEAWRILKDETVTPFFDKWKKDGTLNPELVKESVTTATKSINAILNAEKSKRK
jgi:hypothetical protein